MRILSLLFFGSIFLIGCATLESRSDFVVDSSRYLNEYRSACKKENSHLWNQSLCVPIVIVEPHSRDAVASEPDPEGRFRKFSNSYQGKFYGSNLYANTSAKWGGRNWSMLVWPLPSDASERLSLFFHEAFHSIQNDLGLPMNNAVNTHLDQEEARILIRLEWSALIHALEDPEKRGKHVQAALEIRRQRFQKFRGAQKNEEDLEMNEGVAEYTGVKLRGTELDETYQYLKKKIAAVPEVFSLTRSSAYYSGPLYGLLLDTKDPQWTSTIHKTRSFSEMASKLFEVKPSTLNPATLKQYGYEEIAKFERQRAAGIKLRIEKYLKQIDSPGKLEITLNRPQLVFNPYGILSIDSKTMIYETLEVKDEWGELQVKEGVIYKAKEATGILVLGAPTEINAKGAIGLGWRLILAPQWEVIKLKNKAVIYKKQNL